METDKKNSDKTELRRRAEQKFEMEAHNTKEFAEMSPEKMSNLITRTSGTSDRVKNAER